MSTLIVTASHVYGGENLTGITAIEFQTSGFSTATFDAAQFGPGLISDAVAITGDGNTNFIGIGLSSNLSSTTSFSAAGWTFSNWSLFPDSINIFGSENDDTITGSSQDDELFGNGGNDTLDSGAADDILNGGLGGDVLTGGAGDDIYELKDIYRSDIFSLFHYDTVLEDANGGHDRVDVQKTSIFRNSYLLPANVEDGSVIGTESFALFGNELANQLIANNAGCSLFGGAGNDTLFGLAGNDTLDGGSGADSLNGGGGIDTATYSSSSAGVSVNLRTGAVAGGDAAGDSFSFVENLAGSAFADTLTGNILANVITGGGGNDLLNGGDGADRLSGNGGNDTLSGGTANDVLSGGASADTLSGGVGHDRFLYINITDSGTTATSRDVITDFTVGVDRIDLSRIDANSNTVADDAFAFIGTAAFSHVAGQLRAVHSNGNTIVAGDVNGDGVADFQIRLNGLHSLTGGDFIL